MPAASRVARAQAYPARPVRIIVGFPAGSVGDIVARLIGQSLSDRLSQWLGWTDAIALSSALNGSPPAVAGGARVAGSAAEGECVRLFLHAALRGVASAAVRLGVVGPAEAQRLHSKLHPLLEDVADGSHADVERAAQISPLADLLQGAHDRLYSRLFQS